MPPATRATEPANHYERLALDITTQIVAALEDGAPFNDMLHALAISAGALINQMLDETDRRVHAVISLAADILSWSAMPQQHRHLQ